MLGSVPFWDSKLSPTSNNDVLAVGGRGLPCRNQFMGQGSLFTGDVYRVTVEDNDVKRWSQKIFTSTCDDLPECTHCSLEWEHENMARNAFEKARYYTLKSPVKISAPYYMVLEINGGLDAVGRFVSFDTNAINASIFSIS